MIGNYGLDSSEYDLSLPAMWTPVDQANFKPSRSVPEVQTDQVGYQGGSENRTTSEDRRSTMIRVLALLFLLAFLTGCSWDNYDVIESYEKAADGYPNIFYEHFVLSHDGRRYYALCDPSPSKWEDPHSTCALKVLKAYTCVESDARTIKSGEMWDLKCKDWSANNVYLYVSKVEAVK